MVTSLLGKRQEDSARRGLAVSGSSHPGPKGRRRARPCRSSAWWPCLLKHASRSQDSGDSTPFNQAHRVHPMLERCAPTESRRSVVPRYKPRTSRANRHRDVPVTSHSRRAPAPPHGAPPTSAAEDCSFSPSWPRSRRLRPASYYAAEQPALPPRTNSAMVACV